MNLIDRDLIPFQTKKFHVCKEIHYRRVADYDDVIRMPVVDAKEEQWCYIVRVDDYRWKCMNCGTMFSYQRENTTTNFKYCPRCGAKVKEEIG